LGGVLLLSQAKNIFRSGIAGVQGMMIFYNKAKGTWLFNFCRNRKCKGESTDPVVLEISAQKRENVKI